ncbi:MAG: hypothetical protein ACK5PJ_05195 [Ralstonia sp.]|jgi:hypothetical protein
MNALWLVPLAMLLWRFQGGGFLNVDFPGRKVWYVIPLLALAAWAVHGGWQAPAVIVAGLLALSWTGHGRWYTLNNKPRELTKRPASPLEKWIERICDRGGRNDHLCLFASKFIAFAPLMLMTALMGWSFASVCAAAAPVVLVAGYALGWEMADQGKTKVPTSFGEYATGLAIGLIIMGMQS